MPRTYLKSTDSAQFKEKNSAKSSVFDSLAIKPGKKKKKKGKENRLFDDSEDSFDSNNEISLKSAATSKLCDHETSSVLQNNDNDDTFDKLFANVKKDKIRVLSVPLDSSSELNPKEEEESNDVNCWGLFKSFSEKDLPDGNQITDSNKQTMHNHKVPDFVVNPVPDVMDYPTVNHHVPEISSLANLPASTNQQIFPDVFQSPCPGSQAQSSYVPENLRSPSIIVLDDDSIHRNPALNSYKKKIFSPATFFSQTPGASKNKKTVSCLTSTPVLSVSRYSVRTPHSDQDHGGGARASIPEDDVFINSTHKGSHGKSLHGSEDRLRAPVHRVHALSSNEIIQGTPESFVNNARGRKNFAGPVLSVMQHYNFRATMISPRSKVIWSPGSALSSSAVSNGRNGISTRSLKSTSSQESNELRSPEDQSQGSNRTNSGSSSKYTPGKSLCKQRGNNSPVESVDCLDQLMDNKQGPVETGRNVDGIVESDMDVDNKDDYEVKEVADDGKDEGEVVGKDEGEVDGKDEGDGEGKDEFVGDREVEEDYVLGCDCGEYELEDWLVMCDGCVHYFHASCIGMPVSYVELLAQPDPPEWFCNLCTESHKAKSDSMTEQSFTSSDHKSISNKNDTLHSSLMFTVDQHLPEVVAKPGKRWRKSIAVGLLNREQEHSISLNKSKVGFDTFALPQLPVESASQTDRRKTRKSVRLSKLHAHQDIPEEEGEDIPAPAHISRKSMKPKSMAARPSFYVVHNPRLSDLSSRDNSLVLQESRRLTTATRPSFYVSWKPDQTMLEKTILVEQDVSDIDKLLSQCTRSSIIDFSDVYGPDTLVNSKKVGEGAFGEVFLISAADDAAERPVLKVVPIGGDLKVNDEEQTKIMDMMSEVVISTSLSNLRNGSSNKTTGFVEVRNCTVFQGSYPDKLLELWDIFDQEKESENTRPDFLPCDQLYIALEFNNGGQDLEKFVFRNASQALAAWKQVVHTLAVAESQLEFEHRDLHWGNILIKEKYNIINI